jgi:hypothetical protein
MSFYKKIRNREDTDFSVDAALEEQYQKMYKKIARDFVHKDDLVEILTELLEGLGLDNQGKMRSIKHAVLKSYEYKNNLERSLSKRRKYHDVDELYVLSDLNKEES